MTVIVRISTSSDSRLRAGTLPVFQDQRHRVVLGTPEPVACPFCNQRDHLVIVRSLSVLDSPPLYHVTCESCGADGPEASCRRAAAVLWNVQGVTAENRYYRLLCGPGEA
jgi:hypothetical protein